MDESNIDGTEFGFTWNGGEWKKHESGTDYFLYDWIMIDNLGTEVITYCFDLIGDSDKIIIRDTPDNVLQN